MRNVSNADTGRVDDDGGQAETELQSVMEGAAGVEDAGGLPRQSAVRGQRCGAV